MNLYASFIKLGENYINPANVAGVQKSNDSPGSFVILNGGYKIHEDREPEQVLNALSNNQKRCNQINFYA